MKVIKWGEIPQSEWVRKVTCDKCKTEFEFTNSDVKSGQYNEYYVECPLCKQFIGTKS